MSIRFLNLNGSLVEPARATVSVLDHGVLYGDGVFETLRVRNGRIFRVEAHLERLEDGCRRLSLALPWPREDLRTALQETVAANAMQDGALRLTVTRGEGPPLPDPTLCPQPTFFVTARPAPSVSGTPPNWKLRVTGTHPCTFVPGIKSLSYLPFQQARADARAAGDDEALLTREGRVIEAGTSNLFLVLNDRLITPDLTSGCLAGTTRALVLELAASLAIETEERPVHRDELGAAGEVFCTNSLMGIVPVEAVDGQRPSQGTPGPLTQALRAAYATVLRRETGA